MLILQAQFEQFCNCAILYSMYNSPRRSLRNLHSQMKWSEDNAVTRVSKSVTDVIQNYTASVYAVANIFKIWQPYCTFSYFLYIVLWLNGFLSVVMPSRN